MNDISVVLFYKSCEKMCDYFLLKKNVIKQDIIMYKKDALKFTYNK